VVEEDTLQGIADIRKNPPSFPPRQFNFKKNYGVRVAKSKSDGKTCKD